MFFRFIFAIMTMLLCGYAVLSLIAGDLKNRAWQEVAALSFCLGSGIAVFEIFFFGVLAIKPSAGLLALVQLPLYIIGIRSLRAHWRLAGPAFVKPSFFELAWLVLVAFQVVAIACIASSLPMNQWDSWSIYAYKAKLIYYWGAVPDWLFKPLSEGGGYATHYPLFLPLLEAYVWFFLGQANEFYAKLIGPLCLAGILLIFYSALRTAYKRSFALAFVCVLISTRLSDLAVTGYADVILSFTFTCAAVCLWRYIKEGSASLVVVACLCLGIGTWIKNEGLSMWVMMAATLVAMAIARKCALSRWQIIMLVALPFILFLPWVIFRIAHGIGNFTVSYNTPPGVPFVWEEGRVFMVVKQFFLHMFKLEAANLIWAFFFASILLRARKENMFLLCLIAIQLATYAAACFLQGIPKQQFEISMPPVLPRLFSHLYPVVLLFIAQQLHDRFITDPGE